MQHLHTLDKLMRHILNEKRIELKKLERNKEKLTEYGYKLEEDFQAEQAFACQNPESGFVMSSLYQSFQTRKLRTKNKLQQTDEAIESTLESIYESYSEAIRYQTLLNTKIMQMAKERNRKDVEHINEIALNGFTRNAPREK